MIGKSEEKVFRSGLFLKKYAHKSLHPNQEKLTKMMHRAISFRGRYVKRLAGNGLDLFSLVRTNNIRDGGTFLSYFKSKQNMNGSLNLGFHARNRVGYKLLKKAGVPHLNPGKSRCTICGMVERDPRHKQNCSAFLDYKEKLESDRKSGILAE